MTLLIQIPRLMHTATAVSFGAIALWTLGLSTAVHANPAPRSNPRNLKEFVPISQQSADLGSASISDQTKTPSDRQTQISQDAPNPAPSASYAPIARRGSQLHHRMNNTASLSGFFLRNDGAAGQLQIEPFVGNVGTQQPPTGLPTPVAAGTCGF